MRKKPVSVLTCNAKFVIESQDVMLDASLAQNYNNDPGNNARTRGRYKRRAATSQQHSREVYHDSETKVSHARRFGTD